LLVTEQVRDAANSIVVVQIVQKGHLAVHRAQAARLDLAKTESALEGCKKELQESKETIKGHEETSRIVLAEMDKVKAELEATLKKEAELQQKITELEVENAKVQADSDQAYLDGFQDAEAEYVAQVAGIKAEFWEKGWKSALTKAGIAEDHPAFLNPEKCPGPVPVLEDPLATPVETQMDVDAARQEPEVTQIAGDVADASVA